jgi:hypothetical protein
MSRKRGLAQPLGAASAEGPRGGVGLNLAVAWNEDLALLRSQGFVEANDKANVAFLRTRLRV